MFGMNISELGVTNGPQLHIFVVVAIPGTVVLLALAWMVRPFFTRMERRVGWITEGKAQRRLSDPSAAEMGALRQPTIK